MIQAGNNIEVKANGKFAEPIQLDLGVAAIKLDITVLTVNSKEEETYGPLIVQVTESEQHVFENDANESQWFENGFNSREFPTPITGFRVRTPTEVELIAAGRKLPVLPAKFHYVLFG